MASEERGRLREWKRGEGETNSFLFSNKFIEALTNPPESLQALAHIHGRRTGHRSAALTFILWTPAGVLFSSPELQPQALGFPGDDLIALPCQQPRCDEGPILFFLSSYLPASLSKFQNINCALFSICWCRFFTWIILDVLAAFQTTAFLPSNRPTSHRQHAAPEAQLPLPKPCWCFCWTSNAGCCSKGVRCLTTRAWKPDPRAFWRSWRRGNGRWHQHGKPGLWLKWINRL